MGLRGYTLSPGRTFLEHGFSFYVSFSSLAKKLFCFVLKCSHVFMEGSPVRLGLSSKYTA